MGQHNSNFELASEARRAAERFDECEIKVIKETFKDLCHLNGGSMRIDKETFLQYLPLPGLLGERLFAVFDKKCSGEIDYEEFVCGLAVTCRGSWEEKVEFIFNIYDMHGQGAVNREELAALLNHVPTSIMRFGRAVTLDSAASDHGGGNHHHHHHHSHHQSHGNNSHPQQQHHHHPRDQQRRSTGPSLAGQPPHHPHHPGGHPPRHLPPSSSAGTASSAMSGGRCSPDLFLSSVPPVTAAATAAEAAAAAAGREVCRAIADADAIAAGTAGATSGSASAAAAGANGAAAVSAVSAVPTASSGEMGEAGMDGGAGGSPPCRRGSSPPALTSGNLMQLHASLSSHTVGNEGCGGGGSVLAAGAEGGAGVAQEGGGDGGGGDGGTSSPPAVSVASGPAFPAVGSSAGASEGNSAGGGGGNATAATHAGGHAAQGVPREGGGGGAPAASPRGGGDAGLAAEEAAAQEGGGVATAAEGDSSAAVRGPPPALGPVELGAGIGTAEAGGGGGRSRRGTARSDSSTDGGVSCAATQLHPHWEDFTNNDIVDQAFEECDLNHNGKLSFCEFRLWVERNPIVTQFLQSVFPYDEHREWGDDRKHLPFIHNREFTASPMRSEPSVGGEASPEKSDDETRRLLIKARNTTRDEALRVGIDRLIEQQMAGRGVGAEGGPVAGSVVSLNGAASPDDSQHGGEGLRIRSSRRAVTGNIPTGLLSELSPRSAKVMQHQTVAKQGFLWKQGYRLRTWKQRWYVLVGNCIYYYHHEADVYPSKVMFLTGSFVEPLQEVANERKGYWGIEISRNNEQNHRRRWYTRSKVEQLKWVKELRKASAVVPIEDDFEIGEELGKGRFSRVCMCVNKHTLERKAVKIIMKEDMKQDEKDLLRAEIAIMRLVNHPNIIRMEAVYESKKDIFIVMQLHSGGELFDRIVGRPRFTEDEAFTVMFPLVESVAYLHEMGIVHRDLKPENILCGDRIEDIKIADFGLSKMVMPDEIMKMPCGTLTYVAPEVLTLNGYGKEADIWSVGTIMYLLLRGRLPFDGETREEIIENTIHGAIAWQNDHVWAAFSADAQDLVLGMLNKDQSRRYTAKEVLAHPWIMQRELRREEHPEQFEF